MVSAMLFPVETHTSPSYNVDYSMGLEANRYPDDHHDGPTVKHYTLSEPHPGGQSYSSKDYHQKTGEKLFVKPGKHDYLSSRADEKRDKLEERYHARKLDFDDYWHKKYQTSVGGHALDDITKGRVVRHTNEKRTMLLHHDKMDPNIAREWNNRNAVSDLTHKLVNGVNHHYRATSPVRDQDEFGHWEKPIVPLDDKKKEDVAKKLEQFKEDAHNHKKEFDARDKLWHNPVTLMPEPDKRRDAEMEVLNKTIYRKGKSLAKSKGTSSSTQRARSQSPPDSPSSSPKRSRSRSPSRRFK
jgi:hypothetical protein